MQLSNQLVFVRCFTYNHESYIEDALNGFAKQQTTFQYVVSVVDDASTDHNALVITNWLSENCDHNDNYTIEDRDYGKVIHAQVKNNPNCIFDVVLLKENHHHKKLSKSPYSAQFRRASRYMIMCEGDDYWTDPNKLQKQVEYLETHPECSLCFHAAIEHFEDGSHKDRLFAPIENRYYAGEELLQEWRVATASMMFRRDIFQIKEFWQQKREKKIIYGDISIVLASVKCGRVYGMSDVMSVYRRHSGGAVYDKSVKTIHAQAEQLVGIADVMGGNYAPIALRRATERYIRCFYMASARREWEYVIPSLRSAWHISPLGALRNIFTYPMQYIIRRFQ